MSEKSEPKLRLLESNARDKNIKPWMSEEARKYIKENEEELGFTYKEFMSTAGGVKKIEDRIKLLFGDEADDVLVIFEQYAAGLVGKNEGRTRLERVVMEKIKKGDFIDRLFDQDHMRELNKDPDARKMVINILNRIDPSGEKAERFVAPMTLGNKKEKEALMRVHEVQKRRGELSRGVLNFVDTFFIVAADEKYFQRFAEMISRLRKAGIV